MTFHDSFSAIPDDDVNQISMGKIFIEIPDPGEGSLVGLVKISRYGFFRLSVLLSQESHGLSEYFLGSLSRIQPEYGHFAFCVLGDGLVVGG